MTARERFAAHSPYSDPGRHAALLREPVGLDQIGEAVRNLVLHYRAEADLLPAERRGEINARWVSAILDLDQERHPEPVLAPRPPGDRVAGCCRDHALLAVAMLREQGIPARTRIGFTTYFDPSFHGDHVVLDWWNGERWQRADPELVPGSRDFDVYDLSTGEGALFETAAEVWTGYRAGRLDPQQYGVAGVPALSGPGFIRFYVIMEVYHRYGDELLLWDELGAGVTDQDTDRLAALLIKADAGDEAAETELEQWFRTDPRLRPPATVTQLSPYGEPPVIIDLAAGSPVRAGL